MERTIKFRVWDKDVKKWLYHDLLCYENWGQFTGLKDKNGKEIYEGDILVDLSEYPNKDSYDPVYFSGDAFYCECSGWGVQLLSDTNEEDLEIIGNIYENPELLK